MNRRPWRSEARPGWQWLTLPRYIAIQILIVLVAILIGSYVETRTDPSGWCVHFTRFMVCSANAATDYVFAD